MNLQGYYHPCNQSSRQLAALILDADQFRLLIDEHTLLQGKSSQLQISARLGNIPRRLQLPDGSVFITTDNATLDAYLKQVSHPAQRQQFLHQLESHWRWIGLALILTFSVLGAVIQWGVPWASKSIAYALPLTVNTAIASGTLQTLDELALQPSRLPPSRQQALQEHFASLIQTLKPSGFQYTLHFRYWPQKNGTNDKGIANAFALPSGEIVVTDRLIELIAKPAELNGVLLHEIAHVEYRHGLRQLIQSSSLALIVQFMLGDVSALQSVVLALPTFLLQNHYSRDFEREADTFALQAMHTMGLDTRDFAHILRRLEQDNQDLSVGEYLSDHPATVQRIQQAERYAR